MGGMVSLDNLPGVAGVALFSLIDFNFKSIF